MPIYSMNPHYLQRGAMQILLQASDIEHAKDKIMMGAERGSNMMTEDEKRLTAYHEAGHAIVGITVPEQDPVYKVSIMPRGRALRRYSVST